MTERSFERIWRHVCEKDVESLRRIHEDVFDCLKIGQDLEMMKKAIEISETPEDVRLVALLRAKNMYVDIGRCLQYAGRLGRKNVYTTILGGSPSPSSYLCYCMDEESARMCINIPPDDPVSAVASFICICFPFFFSSPISFRHQSRTNWFTNFSGREWPMC